jgi:hypothetical protein
MISYGERVVQRARHGNQALRPRPRDDLSIFSTKLKNRR